VQISNLNETSQAVQNYKMCRLVMLLMLKKLNCVRRLIDKKINETIF